MVAGAPGPTVTGMASKCSSRSFMDRIYGLTTPAGLMCPQVRVHQGGGRVNRIIGLRAGRIQGLPRSDGARTPISTTITSAQIFDGDGGDCPKGPKRGCPQRRTGSHGSSANPLGPSRGWTGTGPETEEYVMQGGEWADEVASHVGLTLEELRCLNPTVDLDRARPNQIIRIPRGSVAPVACPLASCRRCNAISCSPENCDSREDCADPVFGAPVMTDERPQTDSRASPFYTYRTYRRRRELWTRRQNTAPARRPPPRPNEIRETAERRTVMDRSATQSGDSRAGVGPDCVAPPEDAHRLHYRPQFLQALPVPPGQFLDSRQLGKLGFARVVGLSAALIVTGFMLVTCADGERSRRGRKARAVKFHPSWVRQIGVLREAGWLPQTQATKMRAGQKMVELAITGAATAATWTEALQKAWQIASRPLAGNPIPNLAFIALSTKTSTPGLAEVAAALGGLTPNDAPLVGVVASREGIFPPGLDGESAVVVTLASTDLVIATAQIRGEEGTDRGAELCIWRVVDEAVASLVYKVTKSQTCLRAIVVLAPESILASVLQHVEAAFRLQSLVVFGPARGRFSEAEWHFTVEPTSGSVSSLGTITLVGVTATHSAVGLAHVIAQWLYESDGTVLKYPEWRYD